MPLPTGPGLGDSLPGQGTKEGRKERSHGAANPGATSMAVAPDLPAAATQTANPHHTFQQMTGHSTETWRVRAAVCHPPSKTSTRRFVPPRVATFPARGRQEVIQARGHRVCHSPLLAGGRGAAKPGE